MRGFEICTAELKIKEFRVTKLRKGETEAQNTLTLSTSTP